MASRSEEDLSCPVCHDVFRDPVVLGCSHSFCKSCVQRWWQGKTTQECPVCKRKSSKTDPPRNLALKNLAENFLLEKKKQGCEKMCSLHNESLKIFCLDHKQPVCVVCRDSKAHSDHRFRPVNEAAQELRQELQKDLKPFQEKRELLQKLKGNYDESMKFVKVQSQQTERRIGDEFRKLHLFLELEEKARVEALRQEEKQKTQKLKEKMETLNSDIAALSDTIRDAEKALKSEDVSFLCGYKALAKRVQQRPPLEDPKPVQGALIDVVKHLGNLSFNVWSSMRPSYSPVLLDPNTADPELLVSDDLTGVRCAEKRQLPKNPERTKFSCCVLGWEGLESGAHSWAVDVGSNEDWELGVLGEKLEEDGHPQVWRILFSGGKLTAFSPSDPEEELPLTKTLERIRVHLDFDEGKLSFSDCNADTHIHTFKHNSAATLYPYMYTEKPQPLRLLPAKVSVVKET